MVPWVICKTPVPCTPPFVGPIRSTNKQCFARSGVVFPSKLRSYGVRGQNMDTNEADLILIILTP